MKKTNKKINKRKFLIMNKPEFNHRNVEAGQVQVLAIHQKRVKQQRT